MKKILIFLTVVIMVCSFASIANAIEYSYTELLPSGWEGVTYCDINDSEKAVCLGSKNYKLSAFFYENGNYSEIAPPPGMTQVWSSGINNNGDIVGRAFDKDYNRMSFVYDGSSYTEIPNVGMVFDINDNGLIIGRTYGPKGLIYDGSSSTTIQPPGLDDVQLLEGINASGEVVGFGNGTNSGVRGFLYSGGSYTVLLKAGWTYSEAYGINDHGDVVGY